MSKIDREISKKIVEQQVKEINPVLVQKYGWKIELAELTLDVFMRSSKDNESYLFRLRCDNFPEAHPQMTFLNPSTRNPDPAAWPVIQPPDQFTIIGDGAMTCLGKPSPGQWTVGEIVHRIQLYLESDKYQGRKKQ